MDALERKIESHLGKYPHPAVIVIAYGTNDLITMKEHAIIKILRDVVNEIHRSVPQCRVMFCDILPRCYYVKAHNQHCIDHKRKSVNRHLKAYIQYLNGISHPQYATTSYDLILGYPDRVHLTRIKG